MVYGVRGVILRECEARGEPGTCESAGGARLGGSLALPSLAVPGLAVPGLAVPGLAFPGLAFPGLAFPGLAFPGLAFPGLAVRGAGRAGSVGGWQQGPPCECDGSGVEWAVDEVEESSEAGHECG